MRSTSLLRILHYAFFSFIFSIPRLSAEPPRTVAESSDYTATMRYDEVLDFIESLQRRSDRIRVETLCTSTEGRDVPLVILGDPAPSTPLQLKHDERLVVYIQANIHAGEVEGKEASLMLARDMLLADDPEYLDRLVVLIAPIFNADGNEKLSPENRRNQVGPEQVGVRHNGQGLDINRDAMKIETPEMQGLVRNVLMRWDPAILVDCHTTNGSYHEEPVTYAWPLNPNGDAGIIAYMRDRMMPAVQKTLKKEYDVLSIPYGNFMEYENPEKGWRTFGHLTRYVTNYIGLRNRLAILDENYAYADYKTRVRGCYSFLRSILDYSHDHHEEIARLVREADEKTVGRFRDAAPDSFAVNVDVRPLDEPVTILGWDMELRPPEAGYPRVKKLDTRRTYTLPFYSDFYPVRSIPLPRAYLLPASAGDAARKLLLHGITVERLTEPASLAVEAFTLHELESAESLY